MQGNRRMLITGGAGFIGSNFVRYWCQNYPQDRVLVLDALTYAGNLANLADLSSHPGFQLFKGNICDRSLVDQLLAQEAIDTLVHFAAESHVDRSILGPAAFIQTNIVGTFMLLEAFRQHWQTHHQPDHWRWLHISTDEVFGSLAADQPAFSEVSPYAPNNPYAASKAGSDHLVRSYHQTYGLPTLMAHCSNNYGPYQFPEKLIPLICINLLQGKPLPVYGDGQNIRDWIYVKDHCQALDTVLQHSPVGETYCIGGNTQITNLELVQMLCDLIDEMAWDLPCRPGRQLITFVQDRPGHDRRYAIDIEKIQTRLKWTPKISLAEGLRRTVAWYISHRDWWEPLLERARLSS